MSNFDDQFDRDMQTMQKAATRMWIMGCLVYGASAILVVTLLSVVIWIVLKVLGVIA